MQFNTKASLREHIMIFHHNGYSCPYCGRRFCRKALLKRHLSVHSGQKDYRCPHCDYATSHKSNLERHKRIHDRLRMYDDDPGKTDLIGEDEEEEEEEEEDEIEVGSENGEMMVGDFGVMDLRREMGERNEVPLPNTVDLSGLANRRLDLSGSSNRLSDLSGSANRRLDLGGSANRRLDLGGSANRRVAELNDLVHRGRGFEEQGNGLDLSRVTLESEMKAELLSRDRSLTQSAIPVHTSRRIQDAAHRLKYSHERSTPCDDTDDDDDIDLENVDDDVAMDDGEDDAIHRAFVERSSNHTSDPAVLSCTSMFTAKERDVDCNRETRGLRVDCDCSEDTVDVN